MSGMAHDMFTIGYFPIDSNTDMFIDIEYSGVSSFDE